MFPKPISYILALGCAVSLNTVSVSAQESLTPAIITNTFPASSFSLPASLATIGAPLTPAIITNTFSASPYILPSSLASFGTPGVSSSSQAPASTSAASTSTSSGTRTTSQTSSGTQSAAATSSSSAAGKIERGSWAGAVAIGVIGWLGVLV
ncbi:hypothetical protein VTL71DRAFT_802 [Oculimacula yallundae]|uniref:Uncharacterized protein n=1 Tax=Oculimacula yallundae TaxID=86028 RepID=A0ABR4D3E5_9HELO